MTWGTASVYDNPADLSANSTVMRFSETEQNGKLEWLIRKDGCMHCRAGCLSACPSAGRLFSTPTASPISAGKLHAAATALWMSV